MTATLGTGVRRYPDVVGEGASGRVLHPSAALARSLMEAPFAVPESAAVLPGVGTAARSDRSISAFLLPVGGASVSAAAAAPVTKETESLTGGSVRAGVDLEPFGQGAAVDPGSSWARGLDAVNRTAQQDGVFADDELLEAVFGPDRDEFRRS
jgi:hypothetical protein